MDIRALDAIVVFQKRPGPDICRQLIFRHADFAALQILRLLDPVGAHINRGVTEGARHKGRYGDIGAIILRSLYRVARQRQFADVELGSAKGAEENLFRDQSHIARIDAVDLDTAVDEGPGAIVVADRNRKIEFGHAPSYLPCAAILYADSRSAPGVPRLLPKTAA